MDKTQFAAYYTDAKVAELAKAFDLVVNKDHWKKAIDALVDTDANLDTIREAVIFYTGSVPTFTTRRDGMCRVQAVGYYVAIGA